MPENHSGKVETPAHRLEEFQSAARIVGCAPSFLRAIERLPSIAQNDSTVLVAGESGTGKELVARAIHYLSERSNSAFVAINCGSFPETLFESELFGHERGAFTNALGRRDGLIAHANGGTLFLDEIDSLPLKSQANLLRVLEDRKFRALGSNTERRSDVRFVAATNAVLAPLMSSGHFRADLFYRLCVFHIVLPSLRDRREDILPLAQYFLEKHRPARGGVLTLTPEARDSLMIHDWPGNVRELENAIVRGVCLARTNTIGMDDLELPAAVATATRKGVSYREARNDAMAIFEREYLGRLMSEHSGNITSAARAARKDRRDFGRLVRKHQLDPKQYLSRGHAG
jgi:transcriptional regulator with PAS, ATPase and Fis domain